MPAPARTRIPAPEASITYVTKQVFRTASGRTLAPCPPPGLGTRRARVRTRRCFFTVHAARPAHTVAVFHHFALTGRRFLRSSVHDVEFIPGRKLVNPYPVPSPNGDRSAPRAPDIWSCTLASKSNLVVLGLLQPPIGGRPLGVKSSPRPWPPRCHLAMRMACDPKDA